MYPYSAYPSHYPSMQAPPPMSYAQSQWAYPAPTVNTSLSGSGATADSIQTYTSSFQVYGPSSNPPENALSSNSSFNSTGARSMTAMTSQTTGPSTKRKRAPNGSTSASKRRNATSNPGRRNTEAENDPPIPQQAVPGVGPRNSFTDTASEEHPSLTRTPRNAHHLGSLLNNGTPSESQGTDASDVWYFMRALQFQEKPSILPEREQIFRRRPQASKFPFVGCRLCTDEWVTWKNVNGQTSCIRNHLKNNHRRVWQDIVIAEKLKGYEALEQQPQEQLPPTREPFSLSGFYNRLIKWIAVDDQSLDIVDCPELRDLLLYMNEDLTEKDIPHRSKLSDCITLAFQREYRSMIRDIQNSLGRVSFTSDIWSRQNMSSYMAVTAHHAAEDASGKLIIRSHLVAFREIRGSHTGVNIGKVFLQILKEIDCVDDLSMVTLDNASNNQKMMAELEIELNKLGIPFDKEGNRIRCFPHVINLAVKAGLKALTQNPTESVFDDVDDLYDYEFIHGPAYIPSLDHQPLATLPVELTSNPEYLQALEQDVLGMIRRYVTACRSSGQRRQQFEAILKEGNDSGGWGEEKVKLRNVGLLKDMDIRWSATFLMLDRFLETYLVSLQLIAINRDLSHHSFSDIEIRVASDIREFLHLFHVVQELVSAEKTPTLSLVLPLYEKLIIMLKGLRRKKAELSHGIDASVSKLQEYLAISRGNKVYGLAMVINPTIKFQWLEENWTAEDYMAVRTSVTNVMLEYQKSLPSAPTPQAPVAPISRRLEKTASASGASISQASGLERFNELARSLSSSSIPSEPADSTDLNPSITTLTEPESEEDRARRLDAEARQVVLTEVSKYESAGLIELEKTFDLLNFWQKNKKEYPLLYRIALDILPVQASSVPCERVFSSSKQTDTDRRSNLSMFKMEELQILKFTYRNERLNFNQGLVCTERELSVLDISPTTIRDMISRGEIDKLTSYINESWEGWGQERP